ncbi:hypothetical protein CPB84DRAFT_1750079 [Gymnopilus junonius]|uniref:F-box domain-containing protein n=1 Tax=Gymnopilus junonius TaxID=109634 RepID=A0A9P5NHY4_GYMJU|nr:hypothetical protein CPB84DRAFT_1750079 [Gymnopilus junonius]
MLYGTQLWMDSDQESVAQSLPGEILRTIFVYTVKLASPPFPFQSTFHKYILSPSPNREPVSLTHVCTWWRDVALSIPELWLAVSASPEATRSTTPEVVRIWMAHASKILEPRQSRKRIGLDLQFAVPRITTIYDPHELKHMKETVPIIWENIRWCRSLNMCLDRQCLDLTFDILARNDDTGPAASFLEDLELMFTSNVSSCHLQLDAICTWMHSLPSLRRLKLQFVQIYNHFNLLLETLPLQKMEEVIISSRLSFENSLLCLSKCTAAEAITLAKMGWPIPSPVQLSDLLVNPTITLPHLTSLCLTDSVGPVILLRFLNLPSLKKLTICKSTPSPFDTSIINLEAFLLRSQCPLEVLTVSDSKMLHSYGTALLQMKTIKKVQNVDLGYHHSGRLLKLDFYRMASLSQGVKKLMAWVSFSDSHEHIGWKETLEPQEKLLYWIEDGFRLHEM